MAIQYNVFSANAAREEIVPYFSQILYQLKGFLAPTQDEDQLKVQLQAIGKYQVIACVIGSLLVYCYWQMSVL